MALEAGILSIIVALARRGKLQRLAELKVERLWMVFIPACIIAVSVIVRGQLPARVWVPATGWLHIAATAAILVFFWANRRLPGMKWFIAGWALNFIPIAANGGKMPISLWAAEVARAGEFPELMMRHMQMSAQTHFNFLADIIPAPRPPSIVPGVISAGDVLMAIGIFLLVQLTMRPRRAPSGERQAASKPLRSWLSALRSPLATLCSLLVIAAAYRLVGITWGLPDHLHRFTYHPDEIFQVGAMLRVNPFALHLDPGFYSYPSFYINLGSVVLAVASGYGLSTESGAYLAGRVLTAVLGVLTVPVVYAVGSRLYSRAGALAAAMLFAIMPLHIVHSHFATVDVPATLWVALALLGASLVLTRPSLKAYLLAGAAAGLAFGTKYNTGIVLIPVILAHFLRSEVGGQKSEVRSRLRDHRLWAALGTFLAAFIIATPGAVIWPGKYLGGFLYELKHAASGHGLVFQGRGPGWLDIMTSALGYGLGVILLAMSVISTGYALVRRQRSDWVLLSFLIPYYLLISFSEVRFARYAIPILPAVAILVGRMMADVYEVLRRHASVILRIAWVAICTGLVAYTAIYAAAFVRLFSPTDPRTQAAEWFLANVEPHATVALPTVPWFYSPPFARDIVGMVGRENRWDLMSESRYDLITNLDAEWDASILTGKGPEFVVMSDFEYEDPLRLRLASARAFFDEIDRSYVATRTFKKEFSALGIDFGPTERLPHDMKYMAPTIRIYRRCRSIVRGYCTATVSDPEMSYPGHPELVEGWRLRSGSSFDRLILRQAHPSTGSSFDRLILRQAQDGRRWWSAQDGRRCCSARNKPCF